MFRTSLLALLLAVLAAPAVPAQQTQNDDALAAQLRTLIAPFHGKVSVYAHDLATGQTVAIDADEPVPTASTIKLTILYTALEEMRAGRLGFTDPITLLHEDKVPGSGVLLFFDTPLHIDVKDALTLMINQSDNTATNLMIDRLGLKTIDDQIVALGMKNTWLYKKVYRSAAGQEPADQPQFGLGKTSAREMGGLMERLATCNLGPKPAAPDGVTIPSDKDLCADAMHMLRTQSDRNGIPRYLESLDTTEGESAIANKTGAIDHARNDVGAIDTPKGVIVLSVYTHDNENTSWTADNPALILIAKIAKTVVDKWAPGS
jgi:beta-lactamase class A